MASNDAIEDALTRHQVFLQRYSKGQARRAADYVTEIIQVAEKEMSVDFAELSLARQDRIITAILEKIAELSDFFNDAFVDEMADFLQYELEFGAKVLAANVLVPTRTPPIQEAVAGMLTRVMQLEPTQGYTIRAALSVFGKRKAAEIVRVIRDGVLNGQTTPSIVEALRGIANMQQRQAETLSRTIINHVSVQARQVTMRENPDLIKKYKWIATLDSRTSLICASRDQTIYENLDENPKPPAHFNCRSTITWVLSDEFDIGLKVKGKRPARGPAGPKQVAGDTAYETWLRRQPASFQEEVLGIARAKLFREGNLSIGRFVDDAGRTLSLEQLRSLEPLVFADLGL